MDYVSTTSPEPAEYYRRHAARVRQLASEATTAAVKAHLREGALEYERLAKRANNGRCRPAPERCAAGARRSTRGEGLPGCPLESET